MEERKAVETGYWPIYRYNPLLAAQRLSPYHCRQHAAENGGTVNGLAATGSPSGGGDRRTRARPERDHG